MRNKIRSPKQFSKNSWIAVFVLCFINGPNSQVQADNTTLNSHPRLYFVKEDLPRLRELKTKGVHAQIWKNLIQSADWCRNQTPRQEWIPTIAEDPQYENLYDRFYAAMHDMAIIEHLAFASVLSNPDDDPYFESARSWLLSGCTVWKNEATNSPDASKAYAVLRVMKSLAVSYDLLYDRLSEDEREKVRETLLSVCREYFQFFQIPTNAGEGYNKHHGSVDAAPLGVVALSLLGEVPEAKEWLDLMVKKHVDYLLPHALTPSGTSEQSSNFWASTLHYRIFFMDALKRVTERDLFNEFPQSIPGRIALAATAGPQPADLVYNESNRSVLFGPSYGQINYWSPAMIYLARLHRRSIYQHLALWDQSLGSLQRTRYITPNKKEELLFSFGGYVYLWYDETVPDQVEKNLPLSFEFPEPDVNEAYLRSSYLPGDLVVGFKKGSLIVHSGGWPVLVDMLKTDDINKPTEPVEEMLVADDGHLAMIRCVGPESTGFQEQKIELLRPGVLKLHRQVNHPVSWWYAGKAVVKGNTFTWKDGTKLSIRKGKVQSIKENGFVETKEHYGGMKFADPRPMTYPVVTVEPEQGVIELEIIHKD